MNKRIKRFISSILAASFLLVLSVAPITAEASDDQVECIQYNIEENSYTTVSIPKNDSAAQGYNPLPVTRSIIGSDDRVLITGEPVNYYPASAVGVVNVTYIDGSSARGTGWLFGPNDVATAAHVLVNDEGIPVRSATFYVNGNYYASGENMYIPVEYLETQDSNYDYACFELLTSLGKERGYFGWNTVCAPGDAITIIGRPSDYDISNLAISFGNITSISSSYKIRHNADTLSGMSGAPIFKGSGTGEEAIAVAIHTGGASSYNEGTRINSTVASMLNYYRTFLL